ncbi:MAG: C10 family peptidase [Bacteroidota bacterium]|nr:C10 family peptidase [Bacteroidota bacterium]
MTYPYGIMPNNEGNSEVQRLMKDIGEEVDMDYSCSGSGASMYEADEAFIDAFDFSTSLYDGFNSIWLEQDLNAHRPAILDGCRTRTNRFLGWIYTYSNCHAWVCDGYWKTWNSCYTIESLLHMNWGWNEK